jgi:hypothetical protein
MQVDRLFSNIEQDPESKTFKRRQISLLGATALVGGTTVSACSIYILLHYAAYIFCCTLKLSIVLCIATS